MQLNNQTDMILNQQNMTELSSQDLDNVSGGYWFYPSWAGYESWQNSYFVEDSASRVFGW
jgi:hypothetical protein